LIDAGSVGVELNEYLNMGFAQVTLLPELSRARRLLTTGQYRPHFVIGPTSQRVAICSGNVLTEKYLGVMFVGGPDAMIKS
jgi:hypothetical protein